MTLDNREGQQVPETVFPTRVGDEWVSVSTDDLFKGKKVIVFALPGAFTPTCSATHLPRFNELAPVFFANGIDSIICLSVNDAFVMNAWQGDQKADNIRFIPDGNGDFTRGMGMLVSKSDIGFGDRSLRYSMLVNDAMIEKMFVEPEVPGDPFLVSGAETMLSYVAPDAAQPKRITLFTKPGCGHCAAAKNTLTERGLKYEEIGLGQGGVTLSSLAAVSGQGSTPQVYIDGERIGGNAELQEWLKTH